MSDDNVHQDPSSDVSSRLSKLDLERGADQGQVLVERCRVLLDELEVFQNFLQNEKKETAELRHFKSSVKTECKLLEKLCTSDPTAPKTAHTLRSSNFPFYSAVWDAAKGCTGVVALGKRFHWPSPVNSRNGEKDRNAPGLSQRRTNVLVDIVAQDGLEWVKVSTLTEKRILFDIAKAGWIVDSSSDEEYDSEGDNSSSVQAEGLLKQAESLVKASRADRVRYRHPKIRMVLPKIPRVCVDEVEAILGQIEDMGIEVQRSEDLQPAPPLADVLDRIAVNPFAGFTDPVNIDCTILLALVSDLSHCPVETEEWHHRAVKRQIEMERDDQLLPKSLWPACGPRKLLCTREAAQRMHEIVDLIGTDSEKRRRDFILDRDGTAELTCEQRVVGLQELSTHKIPGELKLPIDVVDVDIPEMERRIGPMVTEVSKILSVINQSVFLYGWSNDMTTISSNRTVAKEIETLVENGRNSDSDKGPDIWLCPTARSLVGKEKTRRNWNN
ncbi:hypothetical protein V495_06405 [Pseudogymnoascus sp. VKM F-4514 (FW-929)]|nr:hypothetical protein V495_06405 [Pseudogymnoascus sp. VKM F-4514 (FW-929)]KFY54898.1 hypothetical protein V497_07373 [Pseudogymnoascus sp. VKM F-4516 (FW-969)]